MSLTHNTAPTDTGKPDAPPRRVVHMHIPKTAGTAIRTAFARVPEKKLRIFSHADERQFLNLNRDNWDVFSGHFGFKTATHLDGDIITVLRHPVDRFVSVYYYWQELLEKGLEVERKTKMTKLYSLEDFVCLHDEMPLIEEFFNRITWQIAYGNTLGHRRELRDLGKTENDVLAMALGNLERFALIGLQSNLDAFSAAVKRRFGVGINIPRVNVTSQRVKLDDLAIPTRRRIYDWLYLDMELYDSAAQMVRRGDRQGVV